MNSALTFSPPSSEAMQLARLGDLIRPAEVRANEHIAQAAIEGFVVPGLRGTALTIGILVELWNADLLQTPCAHCTGRVYLLGRSGPTEAPCWSGACSSCLAAHHLPRVDDRITAPDRIASIADAYVAPDNVTPTALPDAIAFLCGATPVS